MEIIVTVLALYGAYIIWKGVSKGGLLNLQIPFVTERGLLSVKAASYLMLLEEGKSPEQANMSVEKLGMDMPRYIILDSIDYVNHHYSGKQLPMISEAKRKGFGSKKTGSTQNQRFMDAVSDDDEREAVQGEAMLRAYESGASMEDAVKMAHVMGKVYDRRKTDNDTF